MTKADDEFVTAASPTSDKTYSIDKFYTATRNSKGFPGSIRIAIPPEVAAAVQTIVARQAIPYYKVAADFHRDAIVHRAHYIQEWLKDDAPTTSDQLREMKMLLMLESEAANQLAVRKAQKSVYDSIVELIDGAEGDDLEMIRSTARKAILTLSSQRLRTDLQRRLDGLRS